MYKNEEKLVEALNLPAVHKIQQKTEAFKTKDARHWKTKLQELYNSTCLLTGIRAEKNDGVLVAHHLYSKTAYPSLSKNLFNGILIEKDLHNLYHKDFNKNLYGVTPETFLSFIENIEKTEGFYVKKP